MTILFGFLVVLAFFTVGEAFREASDEEFPFQVSIQTAEKRHLCGGAIIAPNWILTAYSCVQYQTTVIVAYGSADSNSPEDSITSDRIEHQGFPNLRAKNNLALIKLQRPFKLSKTAQQAKLPTSIAPLRNTTKLSGWNMSQPLDLPPSLYVCDKYFVIPKDCKRATGSLVVLASDEFCGIDEESQNRLLNLGSTVSKSGIVLGILTQVPVSAIEPLIYVKISEHEEWIKDTLQSDAQSVNWVNDVPRDSASENCAKSFPLIVLSTIFYICFNLNK